MFISVHLDHNKYFIVLARIIECQFHILAFVLKGLLILKMLFLPTDCKSIVSRN